MFVLYAILIHYSSDSRETFVAGLLGTPRNVSGQLRTKSDEKNRMHRTHTVYDKIS